MLLFSYQGWKIMLPEQHPAQIFSGNRKHSGNGFNDMRGGHAWLLVYVISLFFSHYISLFL
jgi:hypothetical protein